MKELIKVIERQGKQLVSIRELYEGLELQRTNRTNWINRNVINNEFFAENKDWIGCMVNIQGNECLDYIVTLEMAKHLVMMARTKKSHEYRNYFLQLEEAKKEKQFESLEHFQKEQCQLGFIMDKLNLSDSGKIRLISDFNKTHNLSTQYLPVYTEEKNTKPLSELLKQFNIEISAVKFNKLMLEKGIIKEQERNSSKGVVKKFKSIVDSNYGKNLINPKNPKETQPHYYEDKFQELINLVL
jgi:phage anti-repressor protein